MFFQASSTQMHRCLHTHTASDCGPASKFSSPKGLIMPSAQYGKSISSPCQMWWASFPPFPFFSSSNTEMHPANSHSCKQSQYVNISILIRCYLESLHPVTLISSLFVHAKQSEWRLIIRLMCTNCPPLSRCNSLGADDIWDQTVRWDPSQWNSWGPGERRPTASTTNLYHRCLHDHGQM